MLTDSFCSFSSFIIYWNLYSQPRLKKNGFTLTITVQSCTILVTTALFIFTLTEIPSFGSSQVNNGLSETLTNSFLYKSIFHKIQTVEWISNVSFQLIFNGPGNIRTNEEPYKLINHSNFHHAIKTATWL